MKGKKILSLWNEPKSHPNKLLSDHLQRVGGLCQNNLSSKKINFTDYLDVNLLEAIAYLIGVAHDFGKSTSYFQEYLAEKDEVKKAKLKNKNETHHGFISALFTYYIVKQYLIEKNVLNEKYNQYLPVISFLVVKRHHGNLNNILDEVIDFDKNGEEILLKQVEAIDFSSINSIYQKLFNSINFQYDCIEFKKTLLETNAVYIYNKLDRYEKKYVLDLSRSEKKLVSNLDEEDTLFFYFLTIFLYSLLLDADKVDAADLKEIERVDIDKNIVDEYIKHNFKVTPKKEEKINSIRNTIYKKVATDSLNDLNLNEDKILSLNVPTGTGKTLSSLSFALKLRKKIEKEYGFKARIIYSLPYLSIIDQNYSVFEDVFKLSSKGNQPTSNILLKHHHLSDITYTSNNRNKEFENVLPAEINKDLLLIEGWNSEIIVTTFVQFFHSLITNKNKSIRKFHNMINSIIILDEVQAIPHYYWLLLNKMVKFLAAKFNTYFIFITATQPLLFNEKDGEIKPLIKNKEEYFNSLDRVELVLNLETICLADFKLILQKDLLENPHKNFLIVLNTIKSSKEIYNSIKGMNLANNKNYYLSTDLVPKIRLKRIEKIKRKTKARKIVVSTQLIEAGVDLDVDVVYRDFAPLDSINQVAGRCNRNFGQKRGIVKIFTLKQEEGKKEFYKFIYDSFIISKTRDIFKEFENKIISEKEFLKLSNLYFDKVSSGKSDDKSIEILKEVKNLNFEEISKFKLIESEYQKVDIFVELNEHAEEVYRKYQNIKEIKNLWDRKNEFLKIRKDFYDYVISIPYQYAGDFIENKEGIAKSIFPKISKEEIKQDFYYEMETGFKRSEDVSEGERGSLIF